MQSDDLVGKEVDQMTQCGLSTFDGSLELVGLQQKAGMGTLVLGDPRVTTLVQQRLLVPEVLGQMRQR
jgi:hypothetical protein